LLRTKLERYEEAEEAYRKALKLDPKDDWAWAQLGRLLHKNLERYDEAEEVFRTVYSLGSHAAAVRELIQLWEKRSDDESSILERSTKMLREALTDSGDDWQVVASLAGILGLQNKWKEAFAEAMPLLKAVPNNDAASTGVTNFLIDAAAAGFAREALELLRNSPALEALEPLEVGLRLYLGQKPRAAREILEVGHDVAERIRKKAEARDRKAEQPQS